MSSRLPNDISCIVFLSMVHDTFTLNIFVYVFVRLAKPRPDAVIEGED